MDNPFEGVDLGMGVRKVRMSIKSKGKGKSGGARVITYSLTVDDEDVNLTLLTIYDKSERSTISDKEIKDLLKNIWFSGCVHHSTTLEIYGSFINH